MAASATFGIFRHPLWVPAFVGSFGALITSATSAAEKPSEGSEATGLVALIFLVIFFFTGAITLGVMSQPAESDSNFGLDQLNEASNAGVKSGAEGQTGK